MLTASFCSVIHPLHVWVSTNQSEPINTHRHNCLWPVIDGLVTSHSNSSSLYTGLGLESFGEKTGPDRTLKHYNSRDKYYQELNPSSHREK